MQTEYLDVYDGYQLNLVNTEIATAIELEYDHNKICFLAKDACNCAICAGLFVDTDLTIKKNATYYNAD